MPIDIEPRLPSPGSGLLVSACMIVKDEEFMLETCLGSLKSLVDEVVIYDTGSIDGTVELADRLGAIVIQGFWDDDFSRARNAALSHCKGEWILWIDADETVECPNPQQLRRHLIQHSAMTSNEDHEPIGGPMGQDEFEAIEIQVVNVSTRLSLPTAPERTVRLFRRSNCHWEGRLHEQVIRNREATGGWVDLKVATTDELLIRHTGYAETKGEVAESKARRNLRIARLDAEESTRDDPSNSPLLAHKLVNLARALEQAGEREQALATFRHALQFDSIAPNEERFAQLSVVLACFQLDRLDDAAEALDRLWHLCRFPTLPRYLEAAISLSRGREKSAEQDITAAHEHFKAAKKWLDGIGKQPLDDDGNKWPVGPIEILKSEILSELGRAEESALVILELISVAPPSGCVELLLRSVEACGIGTEVIAEKLAPWNLRSTLGEIVGLEPEQSDRILESLHAKWPCEPAIIATALLCDESNGGNRFPSSVRAKWNYRIGQMGIA